MLFIIGFIFLSILLLYYKPHEKRWLRRSLPGPFPLPIIGNPLGKEPHKRLQKWYQKYGPIYTIKLGTIDTVVLTERDTLHEAFVDYSDYFTERFHRYSRNIINKKLAMTNSNGEYNKLIRSIAMNGMTLPKIKKLENRIHRQTDRLCMVFKHLTKDGEPVNPISFVKLSTLNVILEFALGKSAAYGVPQVDDLVSADDIINDADMSSNELVSLVNELFRVAGLPFPSDYIPFLRHIIGDGPQVFYDSFKKMQGWANTRIQEKLKTYNDPKQEPNDILEYYLQYALLNDDLKIENIKYFLVDLIMAGVDSTANTILFGIISLANDPSIQERLYSELSNYTPLGGNGEITIPDKPNLPYLNAVIKETLRRYTTVPLGIPHYCNQDIEFRGYEIKKGSQVIQNIYSTGLSEKEYKEPYLFDPNRYLGENSNQFPRYTFGLGGRNCLGMTMAENELFIFFSTLFKTFKFSINSGSGGLISTDGDYGISYSPKPFDVLIEPR